MAAELYNIIMVIKKGAGEADSVTGGVGATAKPLQFVGVAAKRILAVDVGSIIILKLR